MISIKGQTNIALGFFLIVAILGTLLRAFYVAPMPFNYEYLLHAHSHAALLGWVHLALMTLIYKFFLQKTEKSTNYFLIYGFTIFCVLGMLFSFPFQGYALYSIIFSSLYLISTYFFAGYALKNIPAEQKNSFSWKLVKSGLWFMILASLGPWAVGPIIAIAGKSSPLFDQAIFFYIHFLMSGWCIFTLLGLFFNRLEKNGFQIAADKAKDFVWLFNGGLFLSVFLNFLGNKPPVILNLLGGAGATLQVISFIWLLKMVKENLNLIQKEFNPVQFKFLKIILWIFGVKFILLFFGQFPYFAEIAFRYRDLAIFFLHLVFLGIISSTLFLYFVRYRMMKASKPAFWLFGIGFIITQSIILYRAMIAWLGFPGFFSINHILFTFTVFLLLGVGILFFGNLRSDTRKI